MKARRIGLNKDQRIPRAVLLYFRVISFFVRSQRRSFFLINSLLKFIFFGYSSALQVVSNLF
jgi:hypothetical protein